jgi:hypothetical protein
VKAPYKPTGTTSLEKSATACQLEGVVDYLDEVERSELGFLSSDAPVPDQQKARSNPKWSLRAYSKKLR